MELPIKIASGGEVDGYLVQLINVGFAYPSTSNATMLFQNCEFGITSKSRIVLLGENGNGVSITCCCIHILFSLALIIGEAFCV